MMKETLEALSKSFVYESQLANLYESYVDVANEEGASELAKKFGELSSQKRKSLKEILQLIQDVKYQITEDMDDELAVEVGADLGVEESRSNILLAIKKEKELYSVMYPEFAKMASDEGALEASSKFRDLAKKSQNNGDSLSDFLGQL